MYNNFNNLTFNEFYCLNEKKDVSNLKNYDCNSDSIMKGDNIYMINTTVNIILLYKDIFRNFFKKTLSLIDNVYKYCIPNYGTMNYLQTIQELIDNITNVFILNDDLDYICNCLNNSNNINSIHHYESVLYDTPTFTPTNYSGGTNSIYDNTSDVNLMSKNNCTNNFTNFYLKLNELKAYFSYYNSHNYNILYVLQTKQFYNMIKTLSDMYNNLSTNDILCAMTINNTSCSTLQLEYNNKNFETNIFLINVNKIVLKYTSVLKGVYSKYIQFFYESYNNVNYCGYDKSVIDKILFIFTEIKNIFLSDSSINNACALKCPYQTSNIMTSTPLQTNYLTSTPSQTNYLTSTPSPQNNNDTILFVIGGIFCCIILILFMLTAVIIMSKPSKPSGIKYQII